MKIHVKDAIMTTFFVATIGVMLILCSVIFLIYCFAYEVKNKKKLYKEAKIVAVICFIIGIAILISSLLYLNKNMILIK